ncbi:MAG: pyridoxal phosphate-dependent aminotransferase [Gammaproteobacteria bacterium]|nr:pyridoxal phosphate-dependent aminotransferase [Gammaproteobacteria bacterium]
MGPFREEIESIEQNGITSIAFTRMIDPEVIPLWFGEGDVVTPAFIREAAKQALDDGHTFYSHTRGRIELRQALKRYLDDLYDLDIHPDRISVPGSAMLGVTIAAQMALTTGDRALIVGPVWPNIEAVFRVTGARLSYVRQRLTTMGWQLSAREIIDAVTSDTRTIFVNSPCNPTGWIMKSAEQRELVSFCRDNDVLLIADEVYHRTVFDGDKAPSFLEVTTDEDPVVVINSFSKAWAMTGWRIGWVVAPKRHVTAWTALSECFNTGATVFAQLGAEVALAQGDGFVRELQAQYLAGRRLVDQALGQHPLFNYDSPEGAFYVFPSVAGLTDSLPFVKDLLAETDVGLAPGYTFGPGNETHFRLCFAHSLPRLKEGLDRLVAFTERRFGG